MLNKSIIFIGILASNIQLVNAGPIFSILGCSVAYGIGAGVGGILSGGPAAIAGGHLSYATCMAATLATPTP